MNSTTPNRLQFSLQEFLAWSVVFALTLGLLKNWEFGWLAGVAIGVGGFLVERHGRRRAQEIAWWGDWLGLFAGHLLLGSGAHLYAVKGYEPSTWILPLIIPAAPVFALFATPFGLIPRSWNLSLPEVALAMGICLAYIAMIASIVYRYPRYRWAIVAIVLGIGVMNILWGGAAVGIPRR